MDSIQVIESDVEINDIQENVKNLTLECKESLSDISDEPLCVEWPDQISDDGRKLYLSNKMDIYDFKFRYQTTFPCEFIYHENDIHISTYSYLVRIPVNVKQWGYKYLNCCNNYSCVETLIEFYDLDKETFIQHHHCEYLDTPEELVKFVYKYKDEFFCDACKCFIYEVETFFENPCMDCMHKYEFLHN